MYLKVFILVFTKKEMYVIIKRKSIKTSCVVMLLTKLSITAQVLSLDVWKYMYCNKMQAEVVQAVCGVVDFAKAIPAFTKLGIRDQVY